MCTPCGDRHREDNMSILLGHQVKKKERNKVFEGKKKNLTNTWVGPDMLCLGGYKGRWVGRGRIIRTNSERDFRN